MEKGDKIAVVSIVIMLVLISTMSGIILYYEQSMGSLKDNYDTLGIQYNTLDSQYNSLSTEHNSLTINYNDLSGRYNDLDERYDDLKEKYNDLNVPLASIKNRTIYWRIFLRDNSQLEWSLDMGTYLSYVQTYDPSETVDLSNTDTGETYTVTDLKEYVTPEVFSDVISQLTDGRNAYNFVQEVVNIKNQLISYSTGLDGQYRWAVETLTEGTGNCADMSILMASLMKSGNNEANYRLKISFWYCDSDSMVNPQKVNHVVIGVEYSDGTSQLIESTSDIFYEYNQIEGWKFEV